MNDLNETTKNIKCVICDVDGVMTDGNLYYDNHGNELKSFNVQDGVGLKLLMNAGIHVAVITASVSALVDNRMRDLGIEHYYKGQKDKNYAFNTLQAKLKLNLEQYAYIGDDLPDIAIIKQVGLGIAVANANHEVKKHANFLTQNSGGQGAIREVCDMILLAQNKSEVALQQYLSS